MAARMHLRPQGLGSPPSNPGESREGIALPPGDPFSYFPACFGPGDSVAHRGCAPSNPTIDALGSRAVAEERRLRRPRPHPAVPSASGQVLNRALIEEGVLPEGRSLPGDRLLYAVNDRLGENLLSMGLVRAAARVARGWRQDQVQAAGRRAVAALSELVAPFAPQRLAAFRAEGHRLVLSTTTPVDMIAPFAEAIGFDDLIATAYETKDGRYTGRLYEGFVWGTGKLRAVRRVGRRPAGSTWPTATPAATASSTSRSSRASACPHAVNPTPRSRSWPRRGAGRWSTGTGRPASRASSGCEPYHLLRPFVAQAVLPLRALRHRRRRARARPRVRCSWPSNHRSYFDVAALALVAREHRPAGALPRQEGDLRRAGGGTDRPRHRRHRGRPRQRLEPAAARRRGRAEGGRGRHRAAAGDDPAGLRLLRPGAAAARRARPAWPRRPAPPSCPSGCGGPRRCGRARHGCPTSRWCATRPR